MIKNNRFDGYQNHREIMKRRSKAQNQQLDNDSDTYIGVDVRNSNIYLKSCF